MSSAYCELETIRVTVSGGIALVRMDRPPVNAQNRRFREEFVRAFDTISGDEDVRVAVLTGAGHVFSAGADIKERQSLVDDAGAYIAHNRVTRESFFVTTDCAKPVIAALNGAAVGAGYAIAAGCDILIASRDAWVQMPELDRGLVGGATFLAQHFSRTRSRLLFFTGRRIDAAEMHRIGAIDEITEPDELLATAMTIAREIAAKSPRALLAAKASFNAAENMPRRDGYRYEQTVTLELSATDDAAEARAAFLEGRPAVYGKSDT